MVTIELTMNGKTTQMGFTWLNQAETSNWKKVGTGNVVVSGGEWNGTYDNVPVYQYQGNYYVWPDGKFSAGEAIPTTGTTSPTPTPSPGNIGIPANATVPIAVGGGIAALVALVLLLHHSGKQAKRKKYYGW